MDFSIINNDFLTALNDATRNDPRFAGYTFDRAYFKTPYYFNYYTGEKATPADFDDARNKYGALICTYPAAYYAEPLYITVKTLENIYKKTTTGTLSEWIDRILFFCEV